MYADTSMRDLRGANRSRGAPSIEERANILVEAPSEQLFAFGLMVCLPSRAVGDGGVESKTQLVHERRA